MSYLCEKLKTHKNMELNKQHKNKSGIYCIINLANNKKYIGKAIDIYRRIQQHTYGFKRRSKDSNRHLINAWYKYGDSNFTYEILEEIDKYNSDLLKDREVYWINYYNTINREFGYNLSQDSSSQSIVHEETRKLLSELQTGDKNPNYGNRWSNEQKKKASERIKLDFSSGRRKPTLIEHCLKGQEEKKRRFKENPELLRNATIKTSIGLTKYYIDQYTKDRKTLIKRWNTVFNLLEENPTYKRHNIYAVCSGEKPSMYGYWWNKVLIEDKVQTE